MQTFYFNIQSKGGVGKSILTYLQALKNELCNSVAFIDLDGASRTSSRQLAFISNHKRLFEIELFDEFKRIEREKLFKVLEAIHETEYETVYIDFGSAESEQLLRLLSVDFTIDEFKQFEKEMNATFIFNVVVAGGASYTSCFQYLKHLLEITNGQFEVNVFANEFTFNGHQRLIEELALFAKSTKGLIQSVKPFGNIHPERASGIEITANIRDGLGLDSYKSFAARLLIQKEIKKL